MSPELHSPASTLLSQNSLHSVPQLIVSTNKAALKHFFPVWLHLLERGCVERAAAVWLLWTGTPGLHRRRLLLISLPGCPPLQSSTRGVLAHRADPVAWEVRMFVLYHFCSCRPTVEPCCICPRDVLAFFGGPCISWTNLIPMAVLRNNFFHKPSFPKLLFYLSVSQRPAC